MGHYRQISSAGDTNLVVFGVGLIKIKNKEQEPGVGDCLGAKFF